MMFAECAQHICAVFMYRMSFILIFRGEYSHGAAKEIITTVFNAVPEVHYIYLAVPKTSYPGETYDFLGNKSRYPYLFKLLFKPY